MKGKPTQLQRVKNRLRERGEISRNECLAVYISRLGAIIAELKQQGWEFTAGYRKEKGGENYYYTATKIPPRTLFDD